MALSAARDTVERDDAMSMSDDRPMAATTIHAGGLVCLNASGYLVPGAAATTLIAVGRAEESAVNAGAAGALTCKVRQGVFRYLNSSAGEAITIAEIGDDCFVVDDEKVGKTNAGSTLSRAGKVVDVDSAGVWVRIGVGY